MPNLSRLLYAAALAVPLSFGGPIRSVVAQEIVIGTGSTSGVYYHVGRILCRILTQVEPVENLTCIAEPTPGSIHNLQALRAGELPLGVVQSDWQFHAVHGSGPFAEAGSDESLRALFSVHGEPFTLVVRNDSEIEGLAQLQGRRVNIGNPGSGQRGTMEEVMAAMGWTEDDFALVSQLNASEHSLALCHNRIEAFVYTVGHPNASIARATGLCDARIAAVDGPEIDALVSEQPYYVRTEIPGGIYNANPDPVPTFGVIATVVATEAMPEETAYRIVSGLFGNLDFFRTTHPAFGLLDPAAMARDGLSAPLHPGAARYYREAGLLADGAAATDGASEDDMEADSQGAPAADSGAATEGEPGSEGAAETEMAPEASE